MAVTGDAFDRRRRWVGRPQFKPHKKYREDEVAEILTALDIRWEYECWEYPCGARACRPDFWLPATRDFPEQHLEITTSIHPDQKRHKVNKVQRLYRIPVTVIDTEILNRLQSDPLLLVDLICDAEVPAELLSA